MHMLIDVVIHYPSLFNMEMFGVALISGISG